MNAYQLLKARHAERMYKRGQYKGDAPLEKRTKNHVRIVEGENHSQECMYVRMYSTNILTAFRNGDVEVCMGGWNSSNTTKQWMNYTPSFAGFRGFWLGNKSVMGLNQLTITTPNGVYLYYDGIRFNQEGHIVSTPKPFEARRIDKAESKEFMEALKVSGFKDVFPVLYATCQPPKGGRSIARMWKDYLQDADYAHNWPEIIEYFKYERAYDYATHSHGGKEIDNAKACWARMMKQAKQDMYQTIATEVTRLDV